MSDPKTLTVPSGFGPSTLVLSEQGIVPADLPTSWKQVEDCLQTVIRNDSRRMNELRQILARPDSRRLLGGSYGRTTAVALPAWTAAVLFSKCCLCDATERERNLMHYAFVAGMMIERATRAMNSEADAFRGVRVRAGAQKKGRCPRRNSVRDICEQLGPAWKTIPELTLARKILQEMADDGIEGRLSSIRRQIRRLKKERRKLDTKG